MIYFATPMDSFSGNVSTQELFREAKKYAFLAASQLELDSNPIPALGIAGGAADTLAGKYEIYIVHYLFPNLDETRQDILLKLNLLNWDIRRREMDGFRQDDLRKRYQQFLDQTKCFEGALTATQMALLESNFFHPDATTNDFDPDGLEY